LAKENHLGADVSWPGNKVGLFCTWTTRGTDNGNNLCIKKRHYCSSVSTECKFRYKWGDSDIAQSTVADRRHLVRQVRCSGCKHNFAGDWLCRKRFFLYRIFPRLALLLVYTPHTTWRRRDVIVAAPRVYVAKMSIDLTFAQYSIGYLQLVCIQNEPTKITANEDTNLWKICKL